MTLGRPVAPPVTVYEPPRRAAAHGDGRPAAEADGEGTLPLVVDVDGTLVRGDLLWDGLVQVCVRHPAALPALIGAGLRGRAALKAFVATTAELSTATVPLEPAAVRLIEAARAEGRLVVLASGAHETLVAALAARVGADVAWGSDGIENLTGEAKLRRVRERYPRFDYVGNGAADLPLWDAARLPFAMNAGAAALRRARRSRPDLLVVPVERTPRRSLVRALRPHQWVKNALLVFPLLAAHLAWTTHAAIRLALGFVAFSLLASAVYLVNDVVDVPHDRAHRTKRHRPVAAGDVSVPSALGTAAALVALAALVASALPPLFQAVLAGYLVVTTAYSLALKKQPLVDVIVLAMLYTSRLAAGAALVDVPLSRWFLAFSVFFFLALALAKRVVEVRDRAASDTGMMASRGYLAADLPMLTSLGMSAAVASSLVYCLYITEGAVIRLYQHPDLLWLGLPILLYWQTRAWLLACRGAMHEDPVVFALRDRRSYVLFGVFLVVLTLAA